MLPTVADVLRLEPVRRGAPRVLAAADRLDQPVRWVHVIELAEAGHLLRGGELVLSTGIALPPDADGLARYVAGLAAAGASALTVELGSRYVRELPRALVSAAAARRLPLIVLERETQFIAITEAVHAQILDAQVAELRAAQRLDRVFSELAAAGASQDEIVGQASALAGAPVILADLAHRVLACAAAGREAGSLLDGFAARSRALRAPGRVGLDQATGWLVAAVGARGQDWGRLVFVLPGPPDAATPVLAERAATTLALARLVADRGAGHSPERAAHRSVLAAMVGSGYADPADLHARVVALGVPLAGRALLPVVAGLRPRSPGTPGGGHGPVVAGPGADVTAAAAADALAAVCQDLALPAICGPLGDRRAAALIALPPEADPDLILADLAARLRPGSPRWIEALGAGPLVTGLDQFGAALREADEVAGAAARYCPDLPFARLADLRLAGLLYQLRDDPRVAAFAEGQIGPLLAHDAQTGAGLVGLLACYLNAGGSKARAAAHAGIARPTLYERLRQIEQVLGIRLDDPGARLALHAALLALELDRGRGDAA
ncbi:MAG TPA: PucR family transcriptional regulator ligand-binding domain-containing protein [Streptosporangiaceae bacterium]|nr:PucR family transcriptional regulator ligand-binding domain-containing protein [Streptosporangiaceae bacterium]